MRVVYCKTFRSFDLLLYWNKNNKSVNIIDTLLSYIYLTIEVIKLSQENILVKAYFYAKFQVKIRKEIFLVFLRGSQY